jgi:hypothetical protein
MRLNDIWNNYSTEQLLEMLRKVVNENGDINAHDFSKYGIPNIATYSKRLKLNNVSKSLVFELADIKLDKPIPKDTRISNGSDNKILTELPTYLGKGKNANKLIVDWGKVVGMDLDLLYENRKYKVSIINYDKKRRYVDVQYLDYDIFSIATDQLRTGKFGTLLREVRNKEYTYNIGDVIQDDKKCIKITKQIRIKHGNYTIRGYEYECLKCENKDKIDEYNLANGKGCNACCISSNKVNEEFNSVWVTNPELLYLFVNEEDAKTVSIASCKKKIWLKCPRCGTLKYTTMNNIYQRILSGYFPCEKCSDKKSYPEKFVFAVLEQLKNNFKTEVTFEWSKNVQVGNLRLCGNKRYDFYIPDYEIIVETNGLQHYIWQGRGRSLVDEQENDRIKRKLALKYNTLNVNYIVIDCRESTLEWIKQNILKSNLNNVFDLSKIDWDECHKYAISSLVELVCDLWNKGYKSTIEIEKITNIPNARICKYLKQGNKLNMCDYDSQKAMRDGFKKGQQNSTISQSKSLICLDDFNVFFSINDCERKSKLLYGITMWHERLGKACNNGTSYNKHNFKFIKDLTKEEYIKYDVDNKLNKLYGKDLI